MMRRPVRILVLLLTVAVTAAVVWRATLNEQARARMRLEAQQTDTTAADAIFELADLRSTLHAYVAPGQGIDFWSKRAQAQLDSLAGRLRDLEPAATAAGHSLSGALNSLDGLIATEKRARTAVRNEQPLIGGDIVFTEARELFDAAGRDLSDARQAMARAESSREAAMANEQSLLAGGAIAVWIFALIVLVPIPSVTAATPQPAAVSAPFDQGDRRQDSDGLTLAAPVAAAAPELVAPAAPVAPVAPALVAPAAPVAPVAPAPTPVPVAPVALLEDVAQLCTDIGRVADAGELSPLLERAAALLDARGIVVWLVAADGQHLLPAAAHGYDEQLLDRMGSIPIDDQNLTAAAFRTGHPMHAAADASSPGAVAVPMLSASGTSGVVAGEVPEGVDLTQAEALASLIAAQLAGMFPAVDTGGMPKLEAGESERREAGLEA